MDLLELALEQDNLRALSLRLGLAAETLRTARHRGRVSPILAGSLAMELKQDPAKWVVIAAIETERESASKARLLEYFRRRWL